MLSLVTLAIGAFAATNIDNLFVVLAFVAEARGSKRRVIACQEGGSLALIAVANSFGEMLRSLPHGYVGVYVPLYAGHSRIDCVSISLVFNAMIGIWCAGAIWLVKHALLGAPIRRDGTAPLPLILLVTGASVIAQNDTLRVLFGI
jgi:cadmium resistance protein CadD (predicted permease)